MFDVCISAGPNIYLSLRLCLSLSLSLSRSLSFSQSFMFLTLSSACLLSVMPLICLCVYLSVRLSVSLSIYLSVYVCLSTYLSHPEMTLCKWSEVKIKKNYLPIYLSVNLSIFSCFCPLSFFFSLLFPFYLKCFHISDIRLNLRLSR